MSFSLASLMSMKIVPGIAKGAGEVVAATGLAGEPNIRSLQPGSIAFPTDRPNSLVGYTGGWTMGNSNPLNSLMNASGFGNTGGVSARTF